MEIKSANLDCSSILRQSLNSGEIDDNCIPVTVLELSPPRSIRYKPKKVWIVYHIELTYKWQCKYCSKNNN